MERKIEKVLRKLFKIKWVWYRFSNDHYNEHLGILFCNRFILAYYKNSVAVWDAKRRGTKLYDADEIDDLTQQEKHKLKFDTFISRKYTGT